MILQFTIENFLSFRDRTVLSMLADPRVAHKPEQTWATGGHQALRTVALYGANGSGKSNLIKAFDMVRKMVIDGTGGEGERIPVTPFKLDAEKSHAPTHVEVEFILDDVHYSYGFEATTQEVQAEWLYRIDAAGETPLFTRESAKGSSIVLGALSEDSERRGFLGHVATGTLENQLFMAEAGRRKVPELDIFRNYFRGWVVVRPKHSYGKLLTRMDDDEQFRGAVARLLADAGTGITGLRISKRLIEDPPEGFTELLARGPGDSADAIRVGQTAIRLDNDRRLEVLELWAIHSPPQGPSAELSIAEESDGTQRLLHLAPLLHDLGQAYSLCIIDELDRSLHPLITRLFLRRFLAQSQQRAGQLIFTTHDTNILDFQLLSRDSVGFIEKDVNGRSIVYPLSELNQAQVNEVESHGLEAAYLDGRFGAIPFLGIRKKG